MRSVVAQHPTAFAQSEEELIRLSVQRSFKIGVSALHELQYAWDRGLSAQFEAATKAILAVTDVSSSAVSARAAISARRSPHKHGLDRNPAFFVHPTEASHGDLGMVTSADAILALSWSGETAPNWRT